MWYCPSFVFVHEFTIDDKIQKEIDKAFGHGDQEVKRLQYEINLFKGDRKSNQVRFREVTDKVRS